MYENSDPRAAKNLRLFGEKPMIELKSIFLRKAFRESMCDALYQSIETRREVIAFDIINFCKANLVQLTIRELEMKRLLIGKMYTLIEKLVKANALYYVDKESLGNDRMYKL